ncbi:hypothetical protein CD175_21005 [Pseudomonas laurylsulfatiphila]|uniref:Uncharacterized protein n=1 Tax=Pseudomonas laurylsulfatiphila TaxID=2011015 RepID=A0A2S6FIR4_9PSED|nr:hypothetical protein CD175_21005 [Pseudomonas laurylsulfatiphila]
MIVNVRAMIVIVRVVVIVGMGMRAMVVIMRARIMLVRFVMRRFNRMRMIGPTTIVFFHSLKADDRFWLAFLTHGASTGKNNGTIQQPEPTTGSSNELKLFHIPVGWFFGYRYRTLSCVFAAVLFF